MRLSLPSKGVLRIGVVGYSAQKFNETEAHRKLMQALSPFKDSDVELVSGLTDVGIPALAYRIATRFDWKTAGIACVKAKEYKCYPVNRSQIVGDDWGDESRTFLSQIDILVRVGGGAQSKQEVEIAKRTNIPVIEYELEKS